MINERHNSSESVDIELLRKYNLIAGERAEFEKISIHASSSVPVGSRSGGMLINDVAIGEIIRFSDNEAVISPVKKIWEDAGILYLETETSVYKLLKEIDHVEVEQFEFSDIDYIETARGSRYTYLPNGMTQRYKEAEKSLRNPKDVLVFIPDFKSIKRDLSKKAIELFGDNGEFYDDIMLEYIHDSDKSVDVVNRAGKPLKTNKAIEEDGGQVYIAFGSKDKIDFYIPVSHLPRIGYMTFDKAHSVGGGYRRHIGNEVTKIVLK